MNEYEIEHFVLGENDPHEEPAKTLSEIVFLVKNKLHEALDNNIVGIIDVHPRVLISIIVTNILVSLLYNSIVPVDFKRRVELVKESLEEIERMTYDLWNSLETTKADINNPH